MTQPYAWNQSNYIHSCAFFQMDPINFIISSYAYKGALIDCRKWYICNSWPNICGNMWILADDAFLYVGMWNSVLVGVVTHGWMGSSS